MNTHLNKKALASHFLRQKFVFLVEQLKLKVIDLLLIQANRVYYSACRNPYNIANLNIKLVTTLDLSGVPVIQQNNPYSVPTNLSLSLLFHF